MGITTAALKFGIPLALNIGHSIFKGRDMSKAQKKAEEENRRAQAMSNLINALSSSAQHQPYLQEPEYRPSRLTRALGAASLGYDVFSGLKSAAAKEAREKIEDEIRTGTLGKMKGTDAYATDWMESGEGSEAFSKDPYEPGGGFGTIEKPIEMPETAVTGEGGGLDLGEATGYYQAAQAHKPLLSKLGAHPTETVAKAAWGKVPVVDRRQYVAMEAFQKQAINLQKIMEKNKDILGPIPGVPDVGQNLFSVMKKYITFDETPDPETGRLSGNWNFDMDGVMGAVYSTLPFTEDNEKIKNRMERLRQVSREFANLAVLYREARESGVMSDTDYDRAMKQVGGTEVRFDESFGAVQSLILKTGMDMEVFRGLHGLGPLSEAPGSFLEEIRSTRGVRMAPGSQWGADESMGFQSTLDQMELEAELKRRGYLGGP